MHGKTGTTRQSRAGQARPCVLGLKSTRSGAGQQARGAHVTAVRARCSGRGAAPSATREERKRKRNEEGGSVKKRQVTNIGAAHQGKSENQRRGMMSARGWTCPGQGEKTVRHFRILETPLSFFFSLFCVPPVAQHPCNTPCSHPLSLFKPGRFLALVVQLEKKKKRKKTRRWKMKEAGRIEIRTSVLVLHTTYMDAVQIRIISTCISVRYEHEHIYILLVSNYACSCKSHINTE